MENLVVDIRNQKLKGFRDLTFEFSDRSVLIFHEIAKKQEFVLIHNFVEIELEPDLFPDLKVL